MRKIVYSYYALSRGIEPSEESFNRTLATANYLKDNGYLENDILKIFEYINKDIITGEDLPEELWNDSLLNKNIFYYSDILHIKSNPPSWDPITFQEKCEPFFLEMKINFTMSDLLDYYYEKCRIPIGLRDNKKNIGALNHLIKKYNAFNDIPGIDYVLALILRASQDINKELICDIFEIEEYNKEVIEEFKALYEQCVFEKNNKIVWRS